MKHALSRVVGVKMLWKPKTSGTYAIQTRGTEVTCHAPSHCVSRAFNGQKRLRAANGCRRVYELLATEEEEGERQRKRERG
jgi:hypothetical protein